MLALYSTFYMLQGKYSHKQTIAFDNVGLIRQDSSS